jgi:hypothetical protein
MVQDLVLGLRRQREVSKRGYNPAAAVEDVRKGEKEVDSGGDEIKSYNPTQTTRLRDEEDDY